MKRLVPILAMLAVVGCDAESIQQTPMTPTVRLAAVPGRPAAGYFELMPDASRGALLSVTSPQAERVEMHETMSSGTMSSMRPIQRVDVRDDERIIFSPGGRHLMLFGLDPRVRPGGQITLILNFEHGDSVRLGARVVSAGGESH